MSTLNKKQPFGEVWGGNLPYRYTQNGKKFLSDGSEFVEAEGTAAPAAGPAAAAGELSAEQQGQAATAAALAERRAVLQMEAFKILNGTAEQIIAELEDADVTLLPVLLEVETAIKARKTVLEAIGAMQKRRDDEAAEAEGKTSQVDQQLQQ